MTRIGTERGPRFKNAAINMSKVMKSFFLAGNAECLKVLLELGAPLHPRSTEGDTPRDLALYYGHGHIAEIIDNFPVQPPKTLTRMWLHENLGRKVCGV